MAEYGLKSGKIVVLIDQSHQITVLEGHSGPIAVLMGLFGQIWVLVDQSGLAGTSVQPGLIEAKNETR